MKADKLEDSMLWFGLASTFLLESREKIREGGERSGSQKDGAIKKKDHSSKPQRRLGISIRFEFQKSTIPAPSTPNTNIFMVANSTGIAPFRAFLQEKEILQAMGAPTPFGKATLLFGCRHRDTDYIFADELEDYCSRNVLTALFEAFSREEVTSKGEKSIRPGYFGPQKGHDQTSFIRGIRGVLHLRVT